MIDFKTYRLINESLGIANLGISQKPSLGIASNFPTFGEAGMPPEISAKKPKMGMGMGMNDVGMPHDDMHGDEDDMNPDSDMDHDDDQFGGEDDDADMDDAGDGDDDMDDMDGDDADMGDDDDMDNDGDDDADMDHDDDMGDADHQDDDDESMPSFKKPVTPFMKKEGCECEKGDKDKVEDEEGEGESEEENEKKDGDKPVFMMKKKMKKGKDKKCKMMKKESSYDRPKARDNSESGWLNSLKEQLAKSEVNKKHYDGMQDFQKEDVLIQYTDRLSAANEKQPQPGEVGYAPNGRIGGDFTNESVKELIEKMNKMMGK